MSERTDSQINEIIQKAYFPHAHSDYQDWYDCAEKCGHGNKPTQPLSYTTNPTAYLEAMAWAKKQKWWRQFVEKIKLGSIPKSPLKGQGIDTVIDNMAEVMFLVSMEQIRILLDPKQGSHALAEFLEGREG